MKRAWAALLLASNVHCIQLSLKYEGVAGGRERKEGRERDRERAREKLEKGKVNGQRTKKRKERQKSPLLPCTLTLSPPIFPTPPRRYIYTLERRVRAKITARQRAKAPAC